MYTSHLVIEPGEVSVPSENHPTFLWTSFYQYFVYLGGKTGVLNKHAELKSELLAGRLRLSFIS